MYPVFTSCWHRDSEEEEVYSFKLPAAVEFLMAQHIYEVAIMPLSERLKPFQVNPDKVPVLNFSTAYVYRNDGSRVTYVAGCFDKKSNVINLNLCAFKHDDSSLIYTFAHELGHWVWFNSLSDSDRKGYADMVNRDVGDSLTWEYFAEDFRKYACGVKDCPGVNETLQSKADAKKLKEFFSRFDSKG